MMIITVPRSASMDDKREGFVRESIRGTIVPHLHKNVRSNWQRSLMCERAPDPTRKSFNPQIDRFKP
jgi:hypothetical protein